MAVGTLWLQLSLSFDKLKKPSLKQTQLKRLYLRIRVASPSSTVKINLSRSSTEQSRNYLSRKPTVTILSQRQEVLSLPLQAAKTRINKRLKWRI